MVLVEHFYYAGLYADAYRCKKVRRDSQGCCSSACVHLCAPEPLTVAHNGSPIIRKSNLLIWQGNGWGVERGVLHSDVKVSHFPDTRPRSQVWSVHFSDVGE